MFGAENQLFGTSTTHHRNSAFTLLLLYFNVGIAIGFVKNTWGSFPERSKEAVVVPCNDVVLFCKTINSLVLRKFL